MEDKLSPPKTKLSSHAGPDGLLELTRHDFDGKRIHIVLWEKFDINSVI